MGSDSAGGGGGGPSIPGHGLAPALTKIEDDLGPCCSSTRRHRMSLEAVRRAHEERESAGALGVMRTCAVCGGCFGMMGEGFAKCRGRQGGHTCSTLLRPVVLAGLEKVRNP